MGLQEEGAWELQLRLCEAASQRYSPFILTPGPAGFAQRFNAAQLKYAQDLERLGQGSKNAALFAMAAEAYLLPHAWAYQQASVCSKKWHADHVSSV